MSTETTESTDSGDSLYTDIDADRVTFQTGSPQPNPATFAPGMEIQVDDEAMLVMVVSGGAHHRQMLTVVRGYQGTQPAPHAWNTAVFIRPDRAS